MTHVLKYNNATVLLRESLKEFLHTIPCHRNVSYSFEIKVNFLTVNLFATLFVMTSKGSAKTSANSCICYRLQFLAFLISCISFLIFHCYIPQWPPSNSHFLPLNTKNKSHSGRIIKDSFEESPIKNFINHCLICVNSLAFLLYFQLSSLL